MSDKVKIYGVWDLLCLNPDGSAAWKERVHNDPTTAGLTDVLSVYFAGGTQKPLWYAGLIDNTGFDSVDAADTMSSHAGWTEYTGYSGNRTQYTPISVSGGVMFNTSPLAWTFTSDGTIKGVFLVSNATKGGTAGTMWNRALYSQTRSAGAGQTLTASYTLRLVGGA